MAILFLCYNQNLLFSLHLQNNIFIHRCALKEAYSDQIFLAMTKDIARTGGEHDFHQGLLLVLLTECPNVSLQRKQRVCEVCYGQTAVASCYMLNELIKTSNEETWYQT